MGVDISTYRCRVGMFVLGGGCGLMSLFLTFGRVVKLLGSLTLVRILLVMAGVEQNPGPADEKYIFRYQYLLVQIGTDVMRAIFDVRVGNDFGTYLAANNKASKKLKKLIWAKIITADQTQHLPPIDKSPKSINFDITLLACLLRNVCGLRSHKDPVWKNPPPTDFSLEADLARFKECRNNLQHSETVFISETDLTDKWKELSQILIRLNTVCGIPNLSSLINSAEKMDVDKELKRRHVKDIKAWNDMETLIDRGIEDLKLGLAEIKDGQSDMKGDLVEIKDGQSDMKGDIVEIKDGQSDMKGDLVEIKDGQFDMKGDIVEIKDGQSDMKGDLVELKDGQFDMKGDIVEIKVGQSDMKGDIVEIKDGQADMKGDIVEIKDGQSDIKGDIVEIKDGQSDMKGDIVEIKDGQADMKGDIVEIKDGQSDMKGDIVEIKVGQSDMKGDIVEIIDGQEGIKRQIEHIEQTLHEGKPKQFDMDDSDLRNILVKIYKEKCCTLPVSPLCGEDEDKMELLKIYQRPSLCRIPYHRSQQEEENYPISSYEEMFFKDDKQFRNIYVTGDAGVGKTSLCHCMAFLWCKCGEKIGNDNLQKDIDFMKKFEFVFYISLRDTVHEDVLDMIIQQYFYTIPMQENIIKIMLKNVLLHKDCLIILDALDEWSPQRNENKNRELPRIYQSDKCTYLTTCRPYKVENVRLSRKDLDIQIQMTGISKSSTKCFVKEIVKHINDKTKDNKNPDDFIRDIKKCRLQEQIRIPMIAAHLVAVWFDYKLTDMSRSLIYSNIVNMLFKKAEKRKIEFPLPSACTIPLPYILTELVYFKQYFSLLEKMCLLSFRSLFKQDDSVLVFTEEQLMSEPYFVSMEEINVLCKIGILSKNKVIGQFGKQEQKLSFLHKSYLEFFASLFVSSFDLTDAFDDVVKQWKSINDVVQYSNFFLLLAGLSCHRTELLFENIYCTLSDELRLCRINALLHYYSDSYSRQIKSLQNMVINCLKEVHVCGSNDSNVSFKLEDFIFDGSLIIDSDAVISSFDLLKNNLSLNRTCVKSINSVNGEYLEEFNEIKHLQCLNVGKVLPADYEKFTQFILKNKATLHTVCIEGDSDTKPLIPELPVRCRHRLSSFFGSIIERQSLQHLTSLSLCNVKMHHSSLHNLVQFLSDNVLIENIRLTNVWCDNHQRDKRDCTLTLNLPHHTQLISFRLWRVNILCNNVNNTSLKFIRFAPFSERIASCYIDVFNCIKVSQLECLYIDGHYVLDYNTVRTLKHTLNTLPCLKLLSLQDMTLPDDVLLQLHPHATQVKIWLYYVKMSCKCFYSCIENFVNNKSVTKVQLYECKITSVGGETNRELSVQESLDYMAEYLTSIPTVNITNKGRYKGKYFDGLMLAFATTICQ